MKAGIDVKWGSAWRNMPAQGGDGVDDYVRSQTRLWMLVAVLVIAGGIAQHFIAAAPTGAQSAPSALPAGGRPRRVTPGSALSRPVRATMPVSIQRADVTANPEGIIRHVPSVSLAVVDAALAEANSPLLHGTYADGKDGARYLWDEGKVLGVDPGLALAIFYNESRCGTLGIARVTHSITNARAGVGQPALDGYHAYASWQAGIDAAYTTLIQAAARGQASLAAASTTWHVAATTDGYAQTLGKTLADLDAASTAAWSGGR